MEAPYRIFRRFAALSFVPAPRLHWRYTEYLHDFLEIDALKERIAEEAYRESGVFNVVMLNDFKGEELGFHNDHGQEYLAMLTIGASADFGVRSEHNNPIWTVVEHGDLVAMDYCADKKWEHSVRNHGHRQSLVFRGVRT